MSSQDMDVTAELKRLSAMVEQLKKTSSWSLHDETPLSTVDFLWHLNSTLIIFLMQIGFGMLEAGNVRAKNTKSILMKNLLDSCISALVWWAIGASLAYGDGCAFIGAPSEAFYSNTLSPRHSSAGGYVPIWLKSYSYATTSITIVSGAVAERTSPMAYMLHACLAAGLIYPTTVHWVWSHQGWLSTTNPGAFLGGMIDFAGGGLVHMLGGTMALVGTVVVGPRSGRFNAQTGRAVPMPGQSSVFVALGTFFLWLGWLAFNTGSVQRPSAPGGLEVLARVASVTLLGGATGGMTTTLLALFLSEKSWSISACCNGILSGLVSVTAGCSVISPNVAMAVGIVAGGTYYASSHVMLHVCKVDDMVDAFSVHGMSGLWSLIATALFADEQYSHGRSAGVFHGGVNLLGAAVAGAMSIIGWSAALSLLLFGTLRYFEVLRIPPAEELVGMDRANHGGSAYALDATHLPSHVYPPRYEQPPPYSPMQAAAVRSVHVELEAVRRPPAAQLPADIPLTNQPAPAAYVTHSALNNV